MIIWLTAFVLLGIGAFGGYVQGAIRAASSIVGLFIASLLALPLSGIFRPILHLIGLENPFALDALSPVAAFLVVLILVKVGGQAIHQKVEYFFKYKKESRFPHWERLNKRVGLCVGALGGAIYFFLVSLVIYVAGYLAVQISSGDKDSAGLRALNEARREISQTHLDRVLAAHDPGAEEYYDASDIAGLVYHNVLLESRLRRYPAFLSLSERAEFQALGNDAQFQQIWSSGATVRDILGYPKVKAMLDDPNLTAELRRIVGENLKDLRVFLETAKSPKYGDQKLLGRWLINPDLTFRALRQARPGMTSQQLTFTRRQMQKDIVGLVFVAGPENHMALLKFEPDLSLPDRQATVKATGSWSENNGAFTVSMTGASDNVNSPVKFDGDDRIVITKGGYPCVFEREM